MDIAILVETVARVVNNPALTVYSLVPYGGDGVVDREGLFRFVAGRHNISVDELREAVMSRYASR